MLRKKTLEFLVDWGLGAPPPPPPALPACPITEDTGLAAPQAPGRRRGLTEFLTSPLILQLRVQPTEGESFTQLFSKGSSEGKDGG